MILYGWSPSTIESSPPVMTTLCGAFQLSGVNVSSDVETVPSVVSFDATGIVTFASGWLCSTTVNCAVPPPSVVTRQVVGVAAGVAGGGRHGGAVDDRVDLVAVGDEVIDAVHGDGLRRVPVDRRERQRRRRRRAFGRIVRRDGDRDVRARLAEQHDGVGRGAAGHGGLQAAPRRDAE